MGEEVAWSIAEGHYGVFSKDVFSARIIGFHIHMDLTQIHALIQRSDLLTEADRTYWLASLSAMKPERIAALEKILLEGEAIKANALTAI